MDSAPTQSLSDITDAVRQAAGTRTPLYPIAGGTQEHLLGPGLGGHALVLGGLNRIVDYPHRDLTITVQAGVTLAVLQQVLAEQGQTLPLDVPLPHQATVGGSIAANINGPRRTGWGTWRDYVIGLSFLNDRGEEVKAGGRVVKNVAGYDFCKLMTGSFGTLGIITQVTLKVRPRPEKLALLPIQVKQRQLAGVFDLLRASRIRPVIQTLTSINDDDYRLQVGFEDSATAVDWQIAHLQQECKEHIADVGKPVEQQAAEQQILQATAYPSEGPSVSIQASVLGSQVAAFLEQARAQVISLQAHPSVGIITGHLPPGISLPDAKRIIDSLRQSTTSVGGHLTLRRCPAEWRAALLPWGPPRSDWAMMRKIKQALDPHDIFQRGRYEPLYAEAPTT